MDDIPFFDTDDYPIRGGIFADAARAEYDFTSAPPPSTDDKDIPVTSTANIEKGPSPAERAPPETVQKSKSSEALNATGGDNSRSESPSLPDPDSVAMSRVGTSASLPVPSTTPTKLPTANSGLSVATSPSPKRTSWLSRFGAQNQNDSSASLGSSSAVTVKSEKEVCLPVVMDGSVESLLGDKADSTPVTLPTVDAVTQDEPVQAEIQRNGQTTPELQLSSPIEDNLVPASLLESSNVVTTDGQPSTSERAKTLSAASASKMMAEPLRKRSPTLNHQSTQSAAANFFSPPSTGALNSSTSTSSNSTADTTSSTPIVAPRAQTPTLFSSFKSTTSSPTPSKPSTPPPQPVRSQSPTPVANFLAAWKSTKNGPDKQALVANTARDAMRKWGFGVKKDETESRPGSTSGDVERERSPVRNGDAVKPKSFAEMRADVVGRRTGQLDSTLLEPEKRVRTISGSSGKSADGSSPLSNAGGYWGSGEGGEEGSTLRRSLSNSGSKGVVSVAPTLPTALLSPSKPVADSDTNSVDSHVETSDRDRRLSTPASAATMPIHVRQPGQAAMMRIPGIHQSHRGDVMSMGYSPVPPPPPVSPPPPLASPISLSLTDVGMAPKLQNVYRLFQKRDAPSSSDVTTSNSTTSTSTPTSAPAPGSETQTQHRRSSSNGSSKASAVLKQIASMDEAARVSNEVARGGEDGGGSLSRKSSLVKKNSSSQRNSVDVATTTTGALNASSPPPLPPR